METEIPKVYSPENIEPRWARLWVEQNLYRPADDEARPPFCLTIPPPNITGSLHMGHMLEHTEIDILMRWHRMRGENVLWLPGTDHASIATQMIVERELGREALPAAEGPQAQSTWQREGQRLRLEMGQAKFLERCWQWKEKNGGTIRRQMERLGTSVDWTRNRFTMDPVYSRTVTEVFLKLYHEIPNYGEKLIYRDNFIINWCPRCGTVLSDLEVVHEDRSGHLWYIRYPFEDGNGHIVVATTRPETMLGDTAVAVNPADARYQSALGRKIVLPLVKRIIPVIADDFVDPKFGTGAVKVTPAHDRNDLGIGLRHGLPIIKVINERMEIEPKFVSEWPSASPYSGLDRFKARNKIVEDLSAAGALEKIENYPLSVGTCQRCKTVVEPLLSTQWFMRMKPLAEPAIRAVEEGKVRIVPDNYRKIYLDWMNKIYDWCISRQLWWGHRIPAWYCAQCGTDPGSEIVQVDKPERCPHGHDGPFHQDPDVLDTWFSSGLWPFVTMGWPEETADLRRFYPNNLMIMGFDILFLWGARMITLGLKFMKDVPFRELYIHALVRDAERQKMSKTKGNVLDPLEVTEKYGTDAVRFALAISAAPGTDIAFSEDKVESYRAFANKIWNAGRFLLLNLQKMPEAHRAQLAQALEPIPEIGFQPVAAPEHLALADRWIFSRLATVTREIDAALRDYRFHEAAFTIYHFFWHEFCDWYVEWVKPEITRPAEGDKVAPTWINLARVFEASLRLLHPFMPFITEELWHLLPHSQPGVSISLAEFQLVGERVADPISEKQVERIQELVVTVRNAKAEMGLQKQKPSLQVASEDQRLLEIFRTHQDTILRLSSMQALHLTRGRLAAELSDVRSGVNFDLRILHEEKTDPAAERARLQKEKQKLEQQLAQVRAQLANQEFLARAPGEIVRGAEHRLKELEEHLKKVLESLERLG